MNKKNKTKQIKIEIKKKNCDHFEERAPYAFCIERKPVKELHTVDSIFHFISFG